MVCFEQKAPPEANRRHRPRVRRSSVRIARSLLDESEPLRTRALERRLRFALESAHLVEPVELPN